MKNDQILRLLGEVDDRYIEESMIIERKPYQRLKYCRLRFSGWGTLSVFRYAERIVVRAGCLPILTRCGLTR